MWAQDVLVELNVLLNKVCFFRCRGQTRHWCAKASRSRNVLYLFREATDQGQKFVLIQVQEVKDFSPWWKSLFISFFVCFSSEFEISPYPCPFFKAPHRCLGPFLCKTLITNRSTLLLLNFRYPESVVFCKHMNCVLCLLAFFWYSASHIFFFYA